MLPASAAGILAVWASLPSTVEGLVMVIAGLEIGVTGLLLAGNWKAASRRIRARTRLDKRRWPRLSRMCRDTVGWWRGIGALSLVVGILWLTLAVLVVRG
jgi:hypothetical protein